MSSFMLRDGTLTDDPIEWALNKQQNDPRVARTAIIAHGHQFVISTVFIGIMPSTIFETMVFGPGDYPSDCVRTRTEDEAKLVHAACVVRANRGDYNEKHNTYLDD